MTAFLSPEECAAVIATAEAKCGVEGFHASTIRGNPSIVPSTRSSQVRVGSAKYILSKALNRPPAGLQR